MNVLVFIEQRSGELKKPSLEILGEARRQADAHGDRVLALILGHQVDGVVEKVRSDLAESVAYAKHPTNNIPRSGSLYGGAGMAAYTASKAAVAALTEALGEELVADGILVNAVAPSIIDTPANRAAMPDADNSLWPKPEELAETIVFLASPENTTTRSAVVPVYGGA